jgi:hypothetical protein
MERKLIGTAIDQKPAGEDGSHRVGCRTAISRIAMAKAAFNKKIFFCQKIRLKFKENTSKTLNLENKLCMVLKHGHLESTSRSEIPKF